MWRTWTVGLIAIAGAVTAAPGAKDAPKKDAPTVGEWLLVSIDGQNAVPTYCEFRANGDMIVSARFGSAEADFKWQYEVNEKATPARIDMTAGDTLHEGIFKIEGERLTICWREGRGKRPKGFGEKGATQEVFERVKKKD